MRLSGLQPAIQACIGTMCSARRFGTTVTFEVYLKIVRRTEACYG